MIATLLVSTILLSGSPAAPAPSFAVRAATIHLTDGTTLEDGVLWVEGGTIRAVGRGVVPPEGTPIIEHDGSLSAGLPKHLRRVPLPVNLTLNARVFPLVSTVLPSQFGLPLFDFTCKVNLFQSFSAVLMV